MNTFALYSALRLVLLLVVVLVLYLFGARGWLLVVLAALISMALSYLVLRGPRDRLALRIADRIDGGRATRFERKVAAENSVEDAEADATRRTDSDRN